jgi:uncharacterized protein (DUF1786 family)
MANFLLVDIGAGTMDVLYYDDDSKTQFKSVVASPVRTLAEQAAKLPGDLLVTGVEMGGGPVSSVLKQRAKTHEVLMTASAAATIHHDLEQVQSHGIRIVSQEETDKLAANRRYRHLELADVEMDRLKRIVASFGVPFRFEAVGFCAQDHGVPPEGHSHLDHRHHIFKSLLDDHPHPAAILYKHNEIPETLNRLRSIGDKASAFPAQEIYVMDSGMAAMTGALLDPLVRTRQNVLVLDVATSHTLGAAFAGRELAAFFEYHTRDIRLSHLENTLRDLADGRLEHNKILAQGGHGAYTRKALGFDTVEVILATGPKRGLLEPSHLPVRFGAPLGDNMMTGTAGILEALRIRKGLPPLPVL